MTAEAETERKRTELSDADVNKEEDIQDRKRVKIDVTDEPVKDGQEIVVDVETDHTSSKDNSPQKKKQHHRTDTRGSGNREQTNTEGDDQTPRLPVSLGFPTVSHYLSYAIHICRSARYVSHLDTVVLDIQVCKCESHVQKRQRIYFLNATYAVEIME